MSTTPEHEANRVLKAIRLHDWLAANSNGIATAASVAQLGDRDWRRVAELAGERNRTLSPATRAAVVALFRADETVRPHPIGIHS